MLAIYCHLDRGHHRAHNQVYDSPDNMEPKETDNNVVQETTRRKKGAVEAQIYTHNSSFNEFSSKGR